MGQVKGVLESHLGDSFHGTAAYWGDAGSVNVTPQPLQNSLHVDVYFKAEVDNASNPDVHVWFDLAVTGGCQADGTLDLSIDPENVHVDASLGVLAAIGGAFECIGTVSGGPTCIQSGVEDSVRAAFANLPSSGFVTDGIDQCESAPTLVWRVSSTGDIFLTL
jgi:hypothetical protein